MPPAKCGAARVGLPHPRAQALGQAQLAPHLHCGPQAQACAVAPGWQPQGHCWPGQAAQPQLLVLGVCWLAFMVKSP